MADKFIALGIHAALPVLKNYDVYLEKAKNNPAVAQVTNNPIVEKARRNSYVQKANDLKRRSLSRLRKRAEKDERESNSRKIRSSSAYGSGRPPLAKYSSGYESTGYESSGHESNDRGRRRPRQAIEPAEPRSYSTSASETSSPPQNRQRAPSMPVAKPVRPQYTRKTSSFSPPRHYHYPPTSDYDSEASIPHRKARKPRSATPSASARRSHTPAANSRRPPSTALTRPNSSNNPPISSPPSAKPSDATDQEPGVHSSEEERTLRRKERRTMVLSGLAAVATVHTAGSIYGNYQASQAREKALRNGTLDPKAARRERAKHAAHDVASLAIVSLTLKGLRGRWKGAMGQRRELAELKAERERRRRDRGEEGENGNGKGDETSGAEDSEYEGGREERGPERKSSSASAKGRRTRPGLNRCLSYSDSDLPSSKPMSSLKHAKTLPTQAPPYNNPAHYMPAGPAAYVDPNARWMPPPPPMGAPRAAFAPRPRDPQGPSRAEHIYSPTSFTSSPGARNSTPGYTYIPAAPPAQTQAYTPYPAQNIPPPPSRSGIPSQQYAPPPPASQGIHAPTPLHAQTWPAQTSMPPQTSMNTQSNSTAHNPAAYAPSPHHTYVPTSTGYHPSPRSQTFPVAPRGTGSVEDSTYGSMSGESQQRGQQGPEQQAQQYQVQGQGRELGREKARGERRNSVTYGGVWDERDRVWRPA